MFDDYDTVEIFNAKKPYLALESQARAVLVLLGFKGVKDFAKRAAVNHETAGALLGTIHIKHRKHGFVVLQVHEALHCAWMDRRARMTPGTKAFVKEWAKKWKKNVLENVLGFESPGKIKSDDLAHVKDRERKRRPVRASVEKALNALKWE